MRFIAFLEAPPAGDCGNWSAFFPDVLGCTSGGDTFEHTVANAREALALHLAGLAEDGDQMPSARTLTEIVTEPEYAEALVENGGSCIPQVVTASPLPSKRVRVNVTIDESLLTRLDRHAEAEGISRSRMIEDALAMALEE